MYESILCLVDFGTKLEGELAKLVKTILNPLQGWDFFRAYNFRKKS